MDLPHVSTAEQDGADPIALLSGYLSACATVTQGLAGWCRARGIGDGTIRTQVLQRAVIQRGERNIGYRRVRLMSGEAFLSTAEIRYRLDALTASMTRALEETSVPFGEVVAGLGPRRITTFAQTVGGAQSIGGEMPECILVHHATVLDRFERPIARVREAYQRVLIGGSPA